MSEVLKEFYAVTRTSVYHVQECGPWVASAKKIALKGESGIPLGTEIAEGGMIAICRNLQAYVPERYGRTHPMTDFERRIERVNTSYWGYHSSVIVALFADEDSAMACFNDSDQEPCDPRWLDSTKKVLELIGEDHPSFYICHYNDLDLMGSAKAA